MRAAQFQNTVEYPIGHLALAQTRQGRLATIAREDGHHVGVVIKASAFRGNVVSYDHVSGLGRQLLLSVFGDVIGFGGEPHDDVIVFHVAVFAVGTFRMGASGAGGFNTSRFLADHVGQNIGSRFELENQSFPAALDLLAPAEPRDDNRLRAAAITTMVAEPRWSSTARCISAVLRTATRSTPGGASSAVGPLTNTT